MRGQVVAWYTPFIYRILCATADAVDKLLQVISPDTTPAISLQPSEVDGMSDEGLLELFEDRIVISPSVYRFQTTPHTVMKISQDIDQEYPDASEANVLNLLCAKTKVTVPRVRRVVEHAMGNVIVMDLVKGETLDKVWRAFSVWKKIRIAFILRRYIRQLRQLEAPPGAPPGPLTLDSTQPRHCECPSIFGGVQATRGPFASYTDFTAFWDDRCRIGLNRRKIPEDHPLRKERFDDSSPLVLSHMDLNPRNMILGEDGRLWIIDWAWAGYYPVWFEYFTMVDRVENEAIHGFQDRFWELMIPFVCGPFFKQENWLYQMQGGLYSY